MSKQATCISFMHLRFMDALMSTYRPQGTGALMLLDMSALSPTKALDLLDPRDERTYHS